MIRPDILVVGAGPVGCVVAERMASHGLKTLLIDKRPHLAGNCYDESHPAGFYVHRYGPHYFRTESEEVLNYLSKFCEWQPGNYRALAKVGDRLFPFPINLNTLELFFGRQFDAESARKFLLTKVSANADPSHAEGHLLKTVGPEIYEAFFRDYTRKQWGRPASQLSNTVVARVPIYFDRDDRYARAKHQVLPLHGYTALFKKMVSHPNIEIRLNVDFQEVRNSIAPRVSTIYSGPLDQYFEYKLGRLSWRSLRFEFNTHRTRNIQPVGQINYPDSSPFTRTVEFCHIHNRYGTETVVSTEFPSAEGDPYYPILEPGTQRILEDYFRLAEIETRTNHVHFVGRLAQYEYINMDAAIERALKVSAKILAEKDRGP